MMRKGDLQHGEVGQVAYLCWDCGVDHGVVQGPEPT